MSNIAIIIVDFHSTKNCLELSKKLTNEHTKVVIMDNNKINRGFAKAVNLGIKKAIDGSFEKILLLNPDITINSSQIDHLASTGFDIASPILKFKRQQEEILDYGGQVNFVLGRPTHYENSNPTSPVDFVSGAAMMIDSKVFKKIGLFDEQFFMYFEDVDFCLRAKKAGFTIGIDQDVIVGHQISEHKFSRNEAKQKYILTSNQKFISKWVPWFLKPISYLYLFLLWLKIYIFRS